MWVCFSCAKHVCASVRSLPPQPPHSRPNYYCQTHWFNSLYPYNQLLCVSPPLPIPHVHFRPSALKFLLLLLLLLLFLLFLLPALFFRYVTLIPFNSLPLLGGREEQARGLKHQAKGGDIAFWHASYYFPFNFAACGERGAGDVCVVGGGGGYKGGAGGTAIYSPFRSR